MHQSGTAGKYRPQNEPGVQGTPHHHGLSRAFPGLGFTEIPPPGGKAVPRKGLINRINHVHFANGCILVCVLVNGEDEPLLYTAEPQPCAGDELSCAWSAESAMMLPPPDAAISSLIVQDGHSLFIVPVERGSVDARGVTVRLPEVGYEVAPSHIRLQPCTDVRAEIVQGGISVFGDVVEYTSEGFLIRPKGESALSGRWFSAELPAALRLRIDGSLILSNENLRIRRNGEEDLLEAVADTSGGGVSLEGGDARNPLRRLVPAPGLVIRHPLSGKTHRFRLHQLSTSALVVEEDAREAVLFPGLKVSDACIAFGGGLKSDCRVDVARRIPKEDGTFTCFLDIADMSVEAYDRLARLLISTFDPDASDIFENESDGLWEFLFDTGFIYPRKYGIIHRHGEEIKKTYRKVCQRPEIAAHFTCRNGSHIQAHISMIRAYERAWMIHHHAARGADPRRSGVSVLKQIMFYLNDMHRLPSADMNYVMAFFRPENRFPDHIFGGFARHLDDRRGCSLDLMAYLTYTGLSLDIGFPAGWELGESRPQDLEALDRSYASGSGGLLLKAMGLRAEPGTGKSIGEVYREFDLQRDPTPYALRYEGEPRAILLVDRSDPGLNLSELLNNIKLFVIEEDQLPWRVLSTAISKLARLFPMKRVPVLFHPFSYVEAHRVPYDKKYQGWVLDVGHGDAYMTYMRERFRIRYH